MSADDYALLGVAYGVSPEAARAAFRRIALRLHPDKNPAADATEKYLVAPPSFAFSYSLTHSRAFSFSLLSHAHNQRTLRATGGDTRL